ncbi:uncharacterized protein B0H18DRAFT_272386 [Fomitopsis serialis]|uniref:uncharacterized protein n=1 Tax=Fomitopsis serialis TaxID=139415 RepID=UPI002008A7A6|nr:uncharacterized protein B0H18DRAFT_272386 [Neoantrodia serialis]KAH9927765.1 hypothetical protein B0H18DRAFT_272386 [Neoantrodia serialis]
MPTSSLSRWWPSTGPYLDLSTTSPGPCQSQRWPSPLTFLSSIPRSPFRASLIPPRFLPILSLTLGSHSRMSPSTSNDTTDAQQENMSLNTLPYDLLLNVAQHLDLRDIHALQLSCRSLHDFASTRPVFRNLAVALLRRCRALPLAGFQRFSDLTTEQLVGVVSKATRLETAWLTRPPRPARNRPFIHDANGTGRGDDTMPPSNWYKVISAPPNEEVDWLSPITSSYSLCATKSGKVVCWDVHRDKCLAEWDPRERWELWKCRVEFEIRTVFFTMAKVLHRSYEDRLMEFVLMKLQFPEADASADTTPTPTFTTLARFKTIGVVMNVFLLDPSSRLLSAFVWVSASNTIGLYALLDWDKQEYVFIDTGIECSMSSNWSCILYKEQIVIHSEESDYAHQYFYPMSLLRQHNKPSSPEASFVPALSARVSPALTMTAPFIFPPRTLITSSSSSSSSDEEANEQAPRPAELIETEPRTPTQNPNPFPFPPWYPESAHFVRQWWPTMSTVPRLSCTVVLLADHDMESHRTRYVLAQHYFKVPLFDVSGDPKGEAATATDDAESGSTSGSGSGSGSTSSSSGHSTADSTTISVASRADEGADSMMKIWYVSQPFEVVCVLDGVDDDAEDGGAQTERPRPLMAVDFGHAVWVEYVDMDVKEGDESDPKRLRFVSFPPVAGERDGLYDAEGARWEKQPERDVEGVVRTLDIPDDLELDSVETINIDQSQGAVIISVREGKIFILCYE